MENWKPIEGYEGHYEVSDKGRVRSLDRYTNTIDGKTWLVSGRIMSQCFDKNRGYYGVNLTINRVSKKHTTHNLVANAFLEKPNKTYIVLHGKNGVSDNSISNLCWGTHRQNNLDKHRDGTDYNLNKTHCPRGHSLSDENLIPSFKKGRSCLACHRAGVWQKRNGGDLQKISDLCFIYGLPVGKLIKSGLYIRDTI